VVHIVDRRARRGFPLAGWDFVPPAGPPSGGEPERRADCDPDPDPEIISETVSEPETDPDPETDPASDPETDRDPCAPLGNVMCTLTLAAGATAAVVSPDPTSTAAGDKPAAIWMVAVTTPPSSASFHSRSSALGRSASRPAISQTAATRSVLWTT